MIKAILFDGYGTLFNEGKESIPRIAEEIVKKFRLRISPAELFEEWKTNYLNMEREIFANRQPFKTIKEINLESLASTFDRFSIEGRPSEFIDRLFYLWSFPSLFKEVKRTLANLKENYILGILSNTDNETLFSAIKHTRLEIDYILTSEEVRSYKPNIDIFLRACSDLGLNEDELIYVGNSFNDIIGTKKLGIRIIYVNRSREPLDNFPYLPDYEIRSLESIPKILQRRFR